MRQTPAKDVPTALGAVGMHNFLPVDGILLNPNAALSLGSDADNVAYDFEVGGGSGGEVLWDILVYSSKDLDLCQC